MTNSQELSLRARAAAEELHRRRARSGLHDFIMYIDTDYVVSDFSVTLCAELDQFLLDMIAGKRPVLVIGAPPQHGKSTIVSRFLPAYAFGRWPDLQIAGLSYAMSLASDMNRDVQRIMLSDEYKVLFPDSALNQKRLVTVDTVPKRNSEEFEIVGKKGAYRGQGVGGPLTGKRVDLGIIDDPIKNAKEALSPAIKKSIWDWYTSTFLTRLSKNGGQIIMATRWATDDLSGRVLEAKKSAKNIVYKAIDDDGNALIPELHPIEKLFETKAMLGSHFWTAMYQQEPKPMGGQIFKDFGIRKYQPHELPAKFDRMIQSWDMAFKASDSSDYVVGQVWGKVGANFYLLHQIRDRLTFTQSLESVKVLRELYPEARTILIEDKANGPAIIDALKKQVSGILPVTPDGSKEARAMAMTGEWEAGNIYLPADAVWVSDFIDRVTTFPAASHDDEVDAMTQAVRYLAVSSKQSFLTRARS